MVFKDVGGNISQIEVTIFFSASNHSSVMVWISEGEQMLAVFISNNYVTSTSDSIFLTES